LIENDRQGLIVIIRDKIY